MTFYAAVAYDIPDDRRRARVARLLEGYLFRVQRSVFEGHLTARQMGGLQRRLERVLEPGEDAVRIYRLCEDCRRALVVLCGAGPAPQTPAIVV